MHEIDFGDCYDNSRMEAIKWMLFLNCANIVDNWMTQRSGCGSARTEIAN